MSTFKAWLSTHIQATYAAVFALFLVVEPGLVGAQQYTSHDWFKAAIAGCTIAVAYVAANTTTTIGRYAKQTAIVATAVLVSADNLFEGVWTTQKTWQVVAAGALALASVFTTMGPAKAELPEKPVLPGRPEVPEPGEVASQKATKKELDRPDEVVDQPPKEPAQDEWDVAHQDLVVTYQEWWRTRI